MKPATVVSVLAAGLALAACRTSDLPEPRRDRPNILLVVADDLGYSDLGAYGGEIRTPTLNALAESGLVATDFYVSPRGAPTRAMLLTGVDHHLTGFGGLPRRIAPNQRGKPGYEGALNQRVVSVASVLRDAGYHTTMAGKWELGATARSLPAARGFQRSFVLLDGFASHWEDRRSAIVGHEYAGYSENGRLLYELPDGYFSTRHFTDFLMASIEEQRSDGRPFFAYLSFQAPHGPLAVPEDWRDRYAGVYDSGYDAARAGRLTRMKRRGLVRLEVKPFPGIPTVPAWSALSDDLKHKQARRMELYAAMVENLDHHLGRLLDYLREIGEYGDTVVVFLSDNGTEPADRGPAGMDPRARDWLARQFPESDVENWGSPGSFVEYGPAWAQVGMVPFRLFKGTQAEGGVRSPLIVSGPPVQRRGHTTHALLHVTDLAPTFLELAGAQHPSSYRGRPVLPIQGSSLVPLLAGERSARHGPREWLGFELGGDRAIRRGDWKLVWMAPPFGIDDWRLFRLDRDPSELWNRAAEEPDKMRELIELWDQYVEANGVILPGPAAADLADR